MLGIDVKALRRRLGDFIATGVWSQPLSGDPLKINVGKPLVAIIACSKTVHDAPYQAVSTKYLRALVEGSGCQPVILPNFGPEYDMKALARQFDGFLFTGSYSNVDPTIYGGEDAPAGTLDTARDATTLPLMRAAVEAGTPMLAICRGCQEMNVAFGGTLCQDIEHLQGRDGHHPPAGSTLEEAYAPAHSISIAKDGLLARSYGTAKTQVNSYHFQGIARLAPGLAVEAAAPDGQIEAVRVKDAKAFALGVQWHPEWKFSERPQDVALFRQFGDAVRARQAQPQLDAQAAPASAAPAQPAEAPRRAAAIRPATA